MVNSNLFKIGAIILACVVILYLINSNNNKVVEQTTEGFFANDGQEDREMSLQDKLFDTEPVQEQPVQEQPVELNNVENDVIPSEPEHNETYLPVDSEEQDVKQVEQKANENPKDCYPKDQLSPEELLPGDNNSKWAQVNPTGDGKLGDQNFLTAGHHIGVNTVGQTLRNANLQLRSEPPNPQIKVSPWLQSTIEPDTNRKPLEIGGSSCH